MKTDLFVFILVVVVSFISIGFLRISLIELETQLKEQEQELEQSKWYKDRVRYYMLINLKQEEIINQYKQTRELSRGDSSLQELKLHVN